VYLRVTRVPILTGSPHQTGKHRHVNAKVVVCLVLLALLTFVQVAHVHPNEAAADHCPLCIVLHSVVPVVVAAVIVVLIRVGFSAPVLVMPEAVQPSWHPSLFIRPPPLD
jgi:hypothetical protein